MEGQGKLLTPKEVASKVGVSRETVYAWIEERMLEAVDLSAGGVPRWHVSESALAAFIESRKRPARESAEI